MPGIGIVGQRRAVVTTVQQQQQQQLRPSELSPTARNLARLLKTLQEPDVALQALQDALKQQGTLQLSDEDLPPNNSHNSFQQYCIALAQAVEHAHAKASGKRHDDDLSSSDKKKHSSSSSYSNKRRKAKSAYSLFYEAYSHHHQQQQQNKKSAGEEFKGGNAWEGLSKKEKQVFEEKAAALENSSTAFSSLDSQNHLFGKKGGPPAPTLSALKQTSHPSPPPTTTTSSSAEKKSCTTTKVSALVSDSEDAGGSSSSTETAAADETNMNVDSEIAILDFWPVLLEAVHLQVASRTVRTWGKKKIYEVYRLAGPTTPVSDLEHLRKKIADTFLTLYDGSSREDKRCMRYRDCRVFCTVQHRGSENSAAQPKATAAAAAAVPTLWIQVSIGRSMDVQDELNRSVTGEKKKKPGTEFVAMLEPESNLVALTASRAASRSTFTPFVLSTLEKVLTCSFTGGYASKDLSAQRVHDLSGTEPFDLIQTAKAIEAGDAIGRYARYAAAGAVSDPIVDLQAASTGSLLQRTAEQQRLKAASHHGREIASSTELVSKGGNAHLVLIHQKGMFVEHLSKQRKRSREDEEDLFSNCPKRQSLRWDWKGLTSAPAASWRGAASDTADLPKDTFKCRLDLKGPNVFAGMQALVQAGVLQGPLPHYMRDAPLYGGKITVNHGAIVSNSSNNSQGNRK